MGNIPLEVHSFKKCHIETLKAVAKRLQQDDSNDENRQ